ncbi:Putative amino acid metabolism [Pilibacter termitis]|uniref:Putative amino acid metabolism n=1 Tax=Pilibacter termitis TaxID=263852 RepID=A0A1T4QX50_9ENTE|nr:DUF1831 domain-containing protein [Pilibacter termitis]SKA08343.1 Putative amino acid metabolism [Pilibacter termitis]
MAFTKEATVEGSTVKYALNPSVKRFTLRDNGFVETQSGNFQLIRPIEATPQSKEGFKLKITVNRELTMFKMSITTADGLRAVNIFKSEDLKLNQDKFYFLMDGMIDRGVFVKK